MTDHHEETSIEVVRVTDRQILHPLVAELQGRGPTDPATIREMMALQREWEDRQALKAFTTAMHALKRALPPVLCRDTEVHYKVDGRPDVHYFHTSLAAAAAQTFPILSEYGFTMTWEPSSTRDEVTVVAVLTHVEGHSKTTTMKAPPDRKGGKNDAQAVCSTVTMLQRYTMLALLGIATADMTDPKNDGGVEKRQPTVDPAVNLKRAGWLRRKGHSVEEAEALVGKPVPEWDTADHAQIKAWIDAKAAPAPAKAEEVPPFAGEEES